MAVTVVKVVTIGTYGFNEGAFFKALQDVGVQIFYDIRWRRGVRGTEYAFVNHKRLQARLESLGIKYIQRRDLAPIPEIREQQKKADKTERVPKRKRNTLSPEFITAYQDNVLAGFDPKTFLDELPGETKAIALFCVEREPAACHRSLVANHLCLIDGVEVEHLFPGS